MSRCQANKTTAPYHYCICIVHIVHVLVFVSRGILEDFSENALTLSRRQIGYPQRKPVVLGIAPARQRDMGMAERITSELCDTLG